MSTRASDAALLAALADDLELLARIRIRIVREQIRETLGVFRRYLLQSLVIGALAIAAVVFLVRGFVGGVSQLVPGWEWAAELATGVLILGGGFAVHALRRRTSRHRRLRELRRELDLVKEPNRDAA